GIHLTRCPERGSHCLRSGAAARLSMKALIVRPTSEALAPSMAPAAVSAGKLMLMLKYGSTARSQQHAEASEAPCELEWRERSNIFGYFSWRGERLSPPSTNHDLLRLAGDASALARRHSGSSPWGVLIGNDLADD